MAEIDPPPMLFQRVLRSWRIKVVGVFGVIFTAFQVAGVSSVIAAALILGSLWVYSCLEVWFSPWRAARGRYRHSIQLAATAALGIPLVLTAAHIADQKMERISFPWVYTDGVRLNESGMISGVYLRVRVRDYPLDADDSLTTTSSTLHGLELSVFTPRAVSQSGSRYLCHAGAISEKEFKSGGLLAPKSRLGELTLVNETTVLEVHSSARSGEWTGTIVLRRKGTTLDVETWFSGWLVSQSGKRKLIVLNTAIHEGKNSHPRGDRDQVNTEFLIRSGVPVVSDGSEGIAKPCPPFSR